MAIKAGILKPLLVLVISPAPQAHGGVSVFIETMKKNLVNCEVKSFYVGNTANKESIPAKIIRIIKMLSGVLLLMRNNDFDIIHINPTLSYKSIIREGLILLVLRIAVFRKTIVYFHGWHMDVEIIIKGTYLFRKAISWLLNGTKHIMVLAPEFKQSLIEIGVRKEIISCTRTMFDGSIISTGAKGVISGSRRKILFMSRFEAQKGIYELLGAFSELADEFPDTELVFAGDGAENNRLRELAATYELDDRIIFHGYVTEAEKAALLSDCDIFALPTYFPEGMPVALLEAMAAGKPLLTSKAGGIKHIVSEPENGVVIDIVTRQSVKEGLRILLGNVNYCTETGKHNAVYAWNDFEAQIVTAQIEQVFNL